MPILRHGILSLEVPEGWEDASQVIAVGKEEASQVIALGKEEGGFRPNCVFSQEPTKPGETSARFAYRQLRDLTQGLTDYFLVREEEAQFGPNIGFLREHTFSMDKGEIGQFQFYVVISDVAYTFTFTHLRDNIEAARPLAEFIFARARLDPLGFETFSTSRAN